MLEFRPAIVRPAQQLEFPRPVLTFRVQDAWDMLKLKVPLRDGDTLTGHSRKGVAITIEGQIGSQSGALKLSEVEMFDTLELLRSALHVTDDENLYTLTIFRDPVSQQARYFRNCSTLRCDFDLSQKHLFSYAVSVHACDPQLYSGLPS